MSLFKVELTHIAGSSNGRIADSESAHLGSNPSPAANKDYNPKYAIHCPYKLVFYTNFNKDKDLFYKKLE